MPLSRLGGNGLEPIFSSIANLAVFDSSNDIDSNSVLGGIKKAKAENLLASLPTFRTSFSLRNVHSYKTPSTLLGEVPSAVPVASKHPKVTVYMPERILQGLDNWKKCYGVDSRSEAIVTILEDYLEAVFLEQYEEPPKSAAPPRIRLSEVVGEIYELKERVDALEELMDAAQEEVPSTVLAQREESSDSTVLGEAPSTAKLELAEPSEAQGNDLEEQLNTVLGASLSNAPLEIAEPGEARGNDLEEQLSTAHREVPSTVQRHPDESKSSDVLSEAPSTAPIKAPPTPLTQSALAKRLGCSVQVVERHRKQGKESFASWSRQHDPDDLAWRWEGRGVRGNPLRFVPASTKAE